MRFRTIASFAALSLLASAHRASAAEQRGVFLGKAPSSGSTARAVVNAFVPVAASLELQGTDVIALGDGGRVVRFEQTHRGLPVIGRGAVVRLDARGQSLLTSTSLATDLPRSVTPAVPQIAAARAAQRLTPLEVRPDDAHLVVFPSRAMGEARLAWAVTPQMLPGLRTPLTSRSTA
jgi:Zn-dependent metalloprotease